jgi:hypothetical protein
MEIEMENESKSRSSEEEAERALLRHYHKRLTELGVETVERGTRLQHIKWMCLKAEGFDNSKKTSRWLGWIQGWLVAENIYGLTEIMDQTRKEMKQYESISR